MGILTITEYDTSRNELPGTYGTQAGALSASNRLASQPLGFGIGFSAVSNAFSSLTNVITLQSSIDALVTFGNMPTARSNGIPIRGGAPPVALLVQPYMRLAVTAAQLEGFSS